MTNLKALTSKMTGAKALLVGTVAAGAIAASVAPAAGAMPLASTDDWQGNNFSQATTLTGTLQGSAGLTNMVSTSGNNTGSNTSAGTAVKANVGAQTQTAATNATGEDSSSAATSAMVGADLGLQANTSTMAQSQSNTDRTQGSANLGLGLGLGLNAATSNTPSQSGDNGLLGGLSL